MLLSAKHQEEKCYSIFFPGPCMYKGQCHSVATPRALMFTVLVNQIYLFATRQSLGHCRSLSMAK